MLVTLFLYFQYTLYILIRVPISRAELSGTGKVKRVLSYVGRLVALVSLLYMFICSLDILSSAFRLLGGEWLICISLSPVPILSLLVYDKVYDNIREWTSLEFAKSQRAVENREKWRTLVAKSSVVPQRPSRLRERWERRQIKKEANCKKANRRRNKQQWLWARKRANKLRTKRGQKKLSVKTRLYRP